MNSCRKFGQYFERLVQITEVLDYSEIFSDYHNSRMITNISRGCLLQFCSCIKTKFLPINFRKYLCDLYYNMNKKTSLREKQENFTLIVYYSI